MNLQILNIQKGGEKVNMKDENKCTKNNESGITLIALVITIALNR